MCQVGLLCHDVLKGWVETAVAIDAERQLGKHLEVRMQIEAHQPTVDELLDVGEDMLDANQAHCEAIQQVLAEVWVDASGGLSSLRVHCRWGRLKVSSARAGITSMKCCKKQSSSKSFIETWLRSACR